VRKLGRVWIAAVLALTVGAATSAAQVPEDSVVGSGYAGTVGDWIFNLNVHSGPSGENPTGGAAVDAWASVEPPIGVSGDATCLTVRGNQATIGIDVTASNPPGLAEGGLIEVTDGGAEDTFHFALLGSPPAVCPGPTGGGLRVVAGNIVVTDAQPFPTSKTQCRNGGWRSFPGFKNQGDCVNFVATGGKNPPSRP
jgi:hypothetical protein